MKTQNTSYNATRDGQRAMCHDAEKRGLCLMLTRKVKSMGGTGWDESWINTANDTLLIAIRDDLVAEYNNLVTAKQQ